MPAIRGFITQGFTLVELVMVIVVLGVVSTVTTTFLGTGATMYADASERDRLLSQSRFAVERITRELRNAVPNSVRVSTDGRCLEFIPLLSAGRYEVVPLQLAIASQIEFYAADTDVSALTNATFASVYPTSPEHLYNPNYLASNNTVRTIPLNAVNTEPAGSGTKVTLAFSDAGFESDSASQRLYLWQRPVSFCVEGSSLYRYEGYERTNSQPELPAEFQSAGGAVEGVLMAEQLTAVTNSQFFRYDPGVFSRTSVVHLVLSFSSSFADNLFFSQEVHIPNVP